jgi:thioredoxin
MSTIELGAANFEETVTTNQIVFVDFWASWCGPCRQFAPVYEKASEENPDLVFGSVDTEAERALASAAGISSIPTLMAFKDGSLVFAQPGALPAPALTELIEAVRNLDIEQARAQQAQADDEAARGAR